MPGYRIYLVISTILLGFGIAAGQGNEPTKQNQNPVNINSVENNQVPANTNTLNKNEKSISEPSRSALSENYYRSQSSSLRDAVMAAPYDPKGWINYYKAERYGSYSKTSNNISSTRQTELDEIVDEMGKYVPNSYEYHYVKYINGNNDISLFPHLLKAYELNPVSTEILDDFIAYYELTNNISKKTEFCKKLSESREISQEIMEYNFNVLASIEQNGVLITHGEMDTYPVWIWQLNKFTRTDVKIVYLDLCEKDDYRNRILKELGISVSASFNNKSAFLDELASKIQNRPVFMGATIAPEILKPISNKLFVTGLAFRYSTVGFNNISVLQSNWENKFRRDYLTKKSLPGTLHAKMNMNYLPGLILLTEHYRQNGETKKADQTETLAISIAAAGGKEQQVRQMLKKK